MTTLEQAELSVEATTSSPGPFVRVVVRDNGIGMDEEIRRQIFDPFFTTKEIGEGTGLGLSTAHGVAQQHDGWIECSSQPGEGTTLVVLLPVGGAGRGRPAKAIGPYSEAARGGTETILVIEDEDAVRVPVVQVMESYGYTVVSAVNGLEGWEKFSHDPNGVDLVFLDLSLPELSGEEVLRRIRDRAPETRIIISTGHSDASGLEGSETVLLRKPYRVGEALEAIRRVLDA